MSEGCKAKPWYKMGRGSTIGVLQCVSQLTTRKVSSLYSKSINDKILPLLIIFVIVMESIWNTWVAAIHVGPAVHAVSCAGVPKIPVIIKNMLRLGNSWICAITKSHNRVQEDVETDAADATPDYNAMQRRGGGAAGVGGGALGGGLLGPRLLGAAVGDAAPPTPPNDELGEENIRQSLQNQQIRAALLFNEAAPNGRRETSEERQAEVNGRHDRLEANRRSGVQQSNVDNLEVEEEMRRGEPLGGLQRHQLPPVLPNADSYGLESIIVGDHLMTSRGLVPKSVLQPTPYVITAPSGRKITLKRDNILPTDEGSRIGVIYLPRGHLAEMHYVINGEDQGAFTKKLPYKDVPLYAVVDVYGTTKQVRIIQLYQLYGVASLKSACRDTILKHIAQHGVNSLPLPRRLKDYLLFESI
ncbi:unnamed protein product, partial [Meganyctiphanes norvegica]